MPVAPILAAFGIGVALAAAPGPVQAVLITEALRGGIRRGLGALAGASLTFGTILIALALGLTLVVPDPRVVQVLQLAGGLLLLWLSLDAMRSDPEGGDDAAARAAIPPIARGSLAVLLNPGAWLFIAAVASPVIAGASHLGGTGAGLAAAAALMVGAAVGDVVVVLLGGIGLRRLGIGVRLWIRRGLALVLALLGIGLVVGALTR